MSAHNLTPTIQSPPWFPMASHAQPDYDRLVLLTVRRGGTASKHGTVVMGFRDRTDGQGDHYIVTNWADRKDNHIAFKPTEYATERDIWYVAAWAPLPKPFTEAIVPEHSTDGDGLGL